MTMNVQLHFEAATLHHFVAPSVSTKQGMEFRAGMVGCG